MIAFPSYSYGLFQPCDARRSANRRNLLPASTAKALRSSGQVRLCAADSRFGLLHMLHKVPHGAGYRSCLTCSYLQGPKLSAARCSSQLALFSLELSNVLNDVRLHPLAVSRRSALQCHVVHLASQNSTFLLNVSNRRIMEAETVSNFELPNPCLQLQLRSWHNAGLILGATKRFQCSPVVGASALPNMDPSIERVDFTIKILRGGRVLVPFAQALSYRGMGLP